MIFLNNKFLLAIVLILGLIGVFILLMPKAIDMNLEVIGNGKPSVVFVYDPNLAVSNQQATEINRAREMVGDSINFLVARAGDPTSADFREGLNAESTELLFFDPEGNFNLRTFAPLSAEELITSATKR